MQHAMEGFFFKGIPIGRYWALSVLAEKLSPSIRSVWVKAALGRSAWPVAMTVFRGRGLEPGAVVMPDRDQDNCPTRLQSVRLGRGKRIVPAIFFLIENPQGRRKDGQPAIPGRSATVHWNGTARVCRVPSLARNGPRCSKIMYVQRREGLLLFV